MGLALSVLAEVRHEPRPQQRLRGLIKLGIAGHLAPRPDGLPERPADGTEIGTVTSGTLGPTVNQPVALAYLAAAHAAVGTEVFAIVRDKRVAMTVTTLPFVPNRYYRG